LGGAHFKMGRQRRPSFFAHGHRFFATHSKIVLHSLLIVQLKVRVVE
jgi:hypothetical protein